MWPSVRNLKPGKGATGSHLVNSLGNPYVHGLSGPVSHDTARLTQRYPSLARYGVFGVSTWPIECDAPSPFSERFPLGEHAKWRCDTPPPPPPQKGYLSDTCAIPYENPKKKRQMDAIPPSAILSRKGIARYGGVSRTGLLSSWLSCLPPVVGNCA